MASNQASEKDKIKLYIGTYTNGSKEGIHLLNMDPSSGALHKIADAVAEEASYLAMSPSGNYLYAVSEISDFEGRESGAINAFSVDKETGVLNHINTTKSGGAAPCYITHLRKKSKLLLTANYEGGNVVMNSIGSNGEVNPVICSQSHSGIGPNKERQQAPHAHCVITDPDENFVFAVDLGADKIFIYKLDADKKRLSPHKIMHTAPGAGPRHLIFHPNGRFAYLINELDSTITVYYYHNKDGELEEIENKSAVPGDFHGNNQCAEIKISQDGKYLYGSNRGHDSLVVFSIDQATGMLTMIQDIASGGNWPRHFNIDPTGEFLIVANERSNNLITFKIDKETGKLHPTGKTLEIKEPVFVLFES
jgi:6-phosphogluconolactonase